MNLHLPPEVAALLWDLAKIGAIVFVALTTFKWAVHAVRPGALDGERVRSLLFLAPLILGAPIGLLPDFLAAYSPGASLLLGAVGGFFGAHGLYAAIKRFAPWLALSFGERRARR